MNIEKKFFEDNSAGQPFYSMSHGGKFQELCTRIVEDSFEKYSAFTTPFFTSDIKWRKELLGKQDFCTIDSARRRLYVWKAVLNHGILWIIAGGNGRGTSYEWYSEDDSYDELFEEIIEYLFNIYGIHDNG